MFLMIVLTNLGPKSVDLIFYAPNVANLGFWRIVPTIAFYYREKLGPRKIRGGAFSSRPQHDLQLNWLSYWQLTKVSSPLFKTSMQK